MDRTNFEIKFFLTVIIFLSIILTIAIISVIEGYKQFGSQFAMVDIGIIFIYFIYNALLSTYDGVQKSISIVECKNCGHAIVEVQGEFYHIDYLFDIDKPYIEYDLRKTCTYTLLDDSNNDLTLRKYSCKCENPEVK